MRSVHPYFGLFCKVRFYRLQSIMPPPAHSPCSFRWKNCTLYSKFVNYVLRGHKTALCHPLSEWYALQGRNHGWRVKGDQHQGACVPRRPKARPSVGCGRGSPPPTLRVRGYHPPPPGKFLKTQMLNPAFWWLLAVKFLTFRKLQPRSWGSNTLFVLPT